MGYWSRRREGKVLNQIRLSSRALREVAFDLKYIKTPCNFYEAKRLLLNIQELAQSHLDKQINLMIERIEKNEKQR